MRVVADHTMIETQLEAWLQRISGRGGVAGMAENGDPRPHHHQASGEHRDSRQPKGGVWKIAFADFMTAMMCFFLVMWLINAANEDTRQAVASYFNPVRLAELNRKGLQDPHVSEDQTDKGPRSTEESVPERQAPPSRRLLRPSRSADISREALFKDPYKVLAEIAGGRRRRGVDG